MLAGHQDFKGRVRGELAGKQEYKYDRYRGSFSHGDPLLFLFFFFFSLVSDLRAEDILLYAFCILVVYLNDRRRSIDGQWNARESVLEDTSDFRLWETMELPVNPV